MERRRGSQVIANRGADRLIKRDVGSSFDAAIHVRIEEDFTLDAIAEERRYSIERWSDGTKTKLPPGETSVRFEVPDIYRIEGVTPAARRWIVVGPPAESRIYTVIPRVAGPISQWGGWLDHAAELGFDAIRVLPVTVMGASLSPYAVSEHFSIDSSLQPGSELERLAAFDAFIDECARRSMKVCLDLVLNHVAIGGKTALEHPEWLVHDAEEDDGIKRSGWNDGASWNSWRDLAKLDFESFSEADAESLTEYLVEYARFWAERAARTRGILRLDNLHSSNYVFMERLLRILRSEYRDVTILGELFGEEQAIRRTTNRFGVNLILGTPWEHKFVPELRGYIRYVHSQFRTLGIHVPVSSHDSGTIAEEFGTSTATPARYVSAVLMGTGSTGMVMGVEYGERERIDFIGPPERYAVPGEENFAEMIALVNALHRDNAVFRRPGNIIFVDTNHIAILAALRIDPSTGKPLFLICANFDTESNQILKLQELTIGSISLEDTLSSSSYIWRDRLEIELMPGGVAAFRCNTD